MHPTPNPDVHYPTMVAALFKKMDFQSRYNVLLHAALGLAGEAVEVLASDSRENFVEELGDAGFYLEAALQEMAVLTGLSENDIKHQFDALVVATAPYYETEDAIRAMVVHSAAFADQVKKLWVYNKEFNRDMQCEIIHSLAVTWRAMTNAAALAGLPLFVIREANIYKLVTGPNARYKGGVYTDAAANARADKMGDPEEAAVTFPPISDDTEGGAHD